MNKHTVIVNGATLTRNSKNRTYPYVVVLVQTSGQVRAEALERAKDHATFELKEAEKTVKRGVEGGMREYPQLGLKYFEEAVTKAKNTVFKGLAILIDEWTDKLVARIGEPNGDDGYHVGAITWSGTKERAEKERAAWAARVPYGKVVVVETNIA